MNRYKKTLFFWNKKIASLIMAFQLIFNPASTVKADFFFPNQQQQDSSSQPTQVATTDASSPSTSSSPSSTTSQASAVPTSNEFMMDSSPLQAASGSMVPTTSQTQNTAAVGTASTTASAPVPTTSQPQNTTAVSAAPTTSQTQNTAAVSTGNVILNISDGEIDKDDEELQAYQDLLDEQKQEDDNNFFDVSIRQNESIIDKSRDDVIENGQDSMNTDQSTANPVHEDGYVYTAAPPVAGGVGFKDFKVNSITAALQRKPSHYEIGSAGIANINDVPHLILLLNVADTALLKPIPGADSDEGRDYEMAGAVRVLLINQNTGTYREATVLSGVITVGEFHKYNIDVLDRTADGTENLFTINIQGVDDSTSAGKKLSFLSAEEMEELKKLDSNPSENLKGDRSQKLKKIRNDYLVRLFKSQPLPNTGEQDEDSGKLSPNYKIRLDAWHKRVTDIQKNTGEALLQRYGVRVFGNPKLAKNPFQLRYFSVDGNHYLPFTNPDGWKISRVTIDRSLVLGYDYVVKSYAAENANSKNERLNDEMYIYYKNGKLFVEVKFSDGEKLEKPAIMELAPPPPKDISSDGFTFVSADDEGEITEGQKIPVSAAEEASNNLRDPDSNNFISVETSADEAELLGMPREVKEADLPMPRVVEENRFKDLDFDKDGDIKRPGDIPGDADKKEMERERFGPDGNPEFRPNIPEKILPQPRIAPPTVDPVTGLPKEFMDSYLALEKNYADWKRLSPDFNNSTNLALLNRLLKEELMPFLDRSQGSPFYMAFLYPLSLQMLRSGMEIAAKATDATPGTDNYVYPTTVQEFTKLSSDLLKLLQTANNPYPTTPNADTSSTTSIETSIVSSVIAAAPPAPAPIAPMDDAGKEFGAGIFENPAGGALARGAISLAMEFDVNNSNPDNLFVDIADFLSGINGKSHSALDADDLRLYETIMENLRALRSMIDTPDKSIGLMGLYVLRKLKERDVAVKEASYYPTGFNEPKMIILTDEGPIEISITDGEIFVAGPSKIQGALSAAESAYQKIEDTLDLAEDVEKAVHDILEEDIRILARQQQITQRLWLEAVAGHFAPFNFDNNDNEILYVNYVNPINSGGTWFARPANLDDIIGVTSPFFQKLVRLGMVDFSGYAAWWGDPKLMDMNADASEFHIHISLPDSTGSLTHWVGDLKDGTLRFIPEEGHFISTHSNLQADL